MNALMAAVIVSGAAGLIYEALWTRFLTTALGSGSQAVCLVLSVFMASLAAGGWVLGRRADRCRCPLSLYAWLELALAAYGAVSPALFRLSGAWGWLLVVPPAFVMGGTLPVLARQCALSQQHARSVASLYFWNTAGAAGGALAATFLLLPALGVAGSIRVAAAMNLFSAVVALGLRGRQAAAAETRVPEAADAAPAAFPRWLWAVFCISGIGSLACETLWTRLLTLVLGSSAYSFSIMLAAFLAGLALGGLAAPALRRLGSPMLVLGGLQFGVGAISLAALWLFPKLPLAYLSLYSWSGGQGALLAMGRIGLAFLVLFPPALLLGASFPYFAGILDDRGHEGEGTGLAYAASTAGSAAGPWLMSFLLIPAVGLANAALALIAMHLALGAWAFLLDPALRRRGLAFAAAGLAALGLFRPGLSAETLHMGVPFYADRFLSAGKDAAAWRKSTEWRAPEFARDGVHGSVSVWRNRSDGSRTLVINGKADASEGAADMPTQLLLGHLPFIVGDRPAGDPPRVLIIGLGSGVTASAAARHPAAGIEVAEIEREVVNAARLFARANRGVLDDPRVSVAVADGRAHLARSRSPYDIIISEPPNPWVSGVSHLFSEEFYSLARERLNPGGVFCAWLHLYRLPEEGLLAGLESFRRAFPYVSVWRSEGSLLLLGSAEPQGLAWSRIEERLARPEVREDLAPYRLASAPEFLAEWLMDEGGLGVLTAERRTVPHTDDRPMLELSAPLGVNDDKAGERNLALLDRYGTAVSPRLGTGPASLRRLVRQVLASGRPYAAGRELAGLPAGEAWRPGLQRDLGELFLRKGDPRAAAAVFTAAARARPQAAASWLDLARARLEAGERASALEALEKFARLIPEAERGQVALARKEDKAARIHLALALGYARLGESGAAARAFARVVETDPMLMERMRDEGLVR